MWLRRGVLAGVFLGSILAGGAARPASAADPAAARAAFEAAVTDYKQSLEQFEALRTEFQTADESRQAAINEEVQSLVAATKPKVDQVVEKALELYRADPKGSPHAAEVLHAAAEHAVVGSDPRQGGGDQYESALPILEALITGGDPTPQLPVWAALAAIATNDFDKADRYYALAQESGALAGDPGPTDAHREVYGLAEDLMARSPKLRREWAVEEKLRAAEAAADDLPRVELATSKGKIVIELLENEAPIATANFLTLVKKGFYDGVVFHRVLPRFMAQGGDPTGKGTGGPGYSIACECKQPNARKHFRGSLSMAHAGRDTGGSQFFLTFLPTKHLDGEHTVFGRVIEGFDVLGELQRIDPGDRSARLSPDRIEKATVLRDRGHAYDFPKLPGR